MRQLMHRQGGSQPLGMRELYELSGYVQGAAAEVMAEAKRFGATHTVEASSGDPVEQVKEVVKGGVEYAFEAIGFKRTVEQAIAMTLGQIHREKVSCTGYAGTFIGSHVAMIAGIASQPTRYVLKAENSP